MKRLFWFSITFAVLAAFFASTFPDGLDFVSEKMGFAHKAAEGSAPMAGYSLPFAFSGGISTAFAGVAGILIILGLFWMAVYIIKKGKDEMKKTMTLVSLFAMLMTQAAFAARPLVTDDFATVKPCTFDIELGYYSITPKTAGTSSTWLVYQIKRGFAPNFDLGVEVPYSLNATKGIADAIIHAKYKLTGTGENDGLAARLDIKLKNGDSSQGLGTGYMDYTAMLIYSRAFGDIRTHYNASYTLIGVPSGAPAANTVNYAAAIEKEVSKGLELAAEYFGVSATAGCTGNVQFGGRWQANDTIRLDAGYSLALNDNSNNIITAGFTADF